MQIVDYVNVRDTLITLLQSVNTTTASYDLSNDLSPRISTISKLDYNYEPAMINEYPIVAVRLDSKTEEHDSIATSKTDRMINLRVNIFCVWDEMNKNNAEDNLWKMVKNIEANLRDNISLNNYNTAGTSVIDIIPSGVSFNADFGKESAYNKSARIDVDINLNSSSV